jgi:cytochrome c peroxidase
MRGSKALNTDALLSSSEIRGLRTFIGKGRCVSCHNGPMFTDHFFHSTRVPPLDTAKPDSGREQGALTVQSDPFNCLGSFSDAKPADCRELKYIVIHDPSLRRAFKTPSLRGVATRTPYMHAGQFSSLDEVVRHYVKAPEAAPPAVSANGVRGHRIGSELIPIPLDEQEIADLVAFLGTLSDLPQP